MVHQLYTTMTSAFGMTTLLHRLFDIGDNRHTELIIQLHDSRVRTVVGRSRLGCLCDDPTRWGKGFPCQRGHDIALTVGPGGSWTLRHRRKPTIHPSINSHADDRRCHFWLADGRARWCSDSYGPVVGGVTE